MSAQQVDLAHRSPQATMRCKRGTGDKTMRQPWENRRSIFLLFCLNSLLASSCIQAFEQLLGMSSKSRAPPHRLGLLRAAASSEDEVRQLNIAFVSGNSMKVTEMESILARHGATKGPTPETSMVNLRRVNVDLPELQEVDTMAIAKNKALLAGQLCGGACLVEDTSLHFHALGGMPGPYIKWFQDSLKAEGLYNILAAYSDKNATAVCTLAFSPSPHADPVLFTGECKGTIVEPRPGGGFGWDSIFVPNEQESEDASVPFSQMTMDEKNLLSHRGQAVRRWADWLGRNKDALWDRQQKGFRPVGHKGLDFKSDFPEQ